MNLISIPDSVGDRAVFTGIFFVKLLTYEEKIAQKYKPTVQRGGVVTICGDTVIRGD